MLGWCIETLASARLKASVRFPPLRGMYQRGGTCKGCDIDSAFAHRDLYYLNQYRSKLSPHEVVTIMHDKVDHSKTASPVLSHKVKHLDGLMKLLVAVTDILAHGHVD